MALAVIHAILHNDWMRFAATLFLAACGHASTITSQITLHEGLVASDIASYRVSIISPTDKNGKRATHADGTPISCADFFDDTLPADTLTLYIDGTFTFDPNNASSRTHDLSVPPGNGDWALGEAFDAQDTTIARACTNNVSVRSQQTTAVPLDFFPCTPGTVDNPRLTCQ
jgi:hypothetical protein